MRFFIAFHFIQNDRGEIIVNGTKKNTHHHLLLAASGRTRRSEVAEVCEIPPRIRMETGDLYPGKSELSVAG